MFGSLTDASARRLERDRRREILVEQACLRRWTAPHTEAQHPDDADMRPLWKSKHIARLHRLVGLRDLYARMRPVPHAPDASVRLL